MTFLEVLAGLSVSDIEQYLCVEREVILKILADDRYCGRVIGKEGKVVKKIREDTDTHIVVSKSVVVCRCLLTCISQLPNLFGGTPRICNCILLLIVWVRSFSKRLPSMIFAEKRCSFSLFSVKNAKIVQL